MCLAHLGAGFTFLEPISKLVFEDDVELHLLEDDSPVPAPVTIQAGAATQRSPDSSLVNPCCASSCDELRPKDEHGVVAIVTEFALGTQSTVSRKWDPGGI